MQINKCEVHGLRPRVSWFGLKQYFEIACSHPETMCNYCTSPDFWRAVEYWNNKNPETEESIAWDKKKDFDKELEIEANRAFFRELVVASMRKEEPRDDTIIDGYYWTLEWEKKLFG